MSIDVLFYLGTSIYIALNCLQFLWDCEKPEPTAAQNHPQQRIRKIDGRFEHKNTVQQSGDVEGGRRKKSK